MKFSEAVAKIEANPSLKFECISENSNKRRVLRANMNGYFVINSYTYDTRALISSDLAGGRFNGNIHRNSDWTQIIEPVDFITAANSGSLIRPVNSQYSRFAGIGVWFYTFSKYGEDHALELISGMWDIEPD